MGLLQDEEDGDIVVFTAGGTDKSLLFANDGGRIRLDFPAENLDEEERKRARRFFRSMGIRQKVHRVFDTPGGGAPKELRAFQVDFGQNVEAASFLAVDLFLKVYLLPHDFTLVVEES